MSNIYENVFNYNKKRFGELFGQPFSVKTVDYSASNQTLNNKFPQKMYKVEVGSRNLVQSPLPNGCYYCVHGDYKAINPGDVLIPLRTDTSTPTVTIISKSPMEEITAIRTSRICNIRNGQEVLYSNCLFDFTQGSNFPEDPLHRVLSSPKVPENQVILYKRELRGVDFDTEGLILEDITDEVPTYWNINQDNTLGNQMLLTLSMSVSQ